MSEPTTWLMVISTSIIGGCLLGKPVGVTMTTQMVTEAQCKAMLEITEDAVKFMGGESSRRLVVYCISPSGDITGPGNMRAKLL